MIQLCFAGKSDLVRRERDQHAWLAWHVAALVRVPRDQKLPELKSLLSAEAAPSRPQTPDEQWAIWSAIAAAQSPK